MNKLKDTETNGTQGNNENTATADGNHVTKPRRKPISFYAGGAKVQKTAKSGLNRGLKAIENFGINAYRYINNILLPRVARILWVWLVIGVLLHCAEYFWPTIRSEIPVIFGIYDLCMKAIEFIFWFALKGVWSLVTGNFLDFLEMTKDKLVIGWKSVSTFFSTI